jgi:GlpG protein
MRQIATLPRESAGKFADYLRALRIDTRLEALPDGVAVWVCDEDKVARARQELEAFTRDPSDPRFTRAAPAPAEEAREPDRPPEPARAEEGEEDGEEAEPGGERPLTIALIALAVGVGLATNLARESPPTTLNQLRIAPDVLAPSLDAVLAGEAWRLVTPIFIHFSIWHLIFNALMLLSLGGRVETALGPARLLGMVLLFAVLSNLGEYYLDWSLSAGLTYGEPKANFGGLSGVLYGLFGYLWIRGRLDPSSGLALPPDTVVILLGWFVLCLFGAMDPDPPRSKIANVAHAAGLLAGAALGAAPRLFQRDGVTG